MFYCLANFARVTLSLLSRWMSHFFPCRNDSFISRLMYNVRLDDPIQDAAAPADFCISAVAEFSPDLPSIFRDSDALVENSDFEDCTRLVRQRLKRSSFWQTSFCTHDRACHERDRNESNTEDNGAIQFLSSALIIFSQYLLRPNLSSFESIKLQALRCAN